MPNRLLVSSKSSKLIPLARLVRLHGIPKNGVQAFKADLFHSGGSVFQTVSPEVVFISKHAHSKNISESAEDYAPWTLAGPLAPHGGKWGQAKGLLLRFDEAKAPPLGTVVAIPRESFPPPAPGEWYICDLLNASVYDGDGQLVGRVTAFADVAPTLGGSVNLVCRATAGDEFEFPIAWVKDVETTPDGMRLNVPDVDTWRSLDDDTE